MNLIIIILNHQIHGKSTFEGIQYNGVTDSGSGRKQNVEDVPWNSTKYECSCDDIRDRKENFEAIRTRISIETGEKISNGIGKNQASRSACHHVNSH